MVGTEEQRFTIASLAGAEGTLIVEVSIAPFVELVGIGWEPAKPFVVVE